MKLKEREKLKEKIFNVRGNQCEDNDYKELVEDKYKIESDILHYALDYIPLKILKKIIKKNEVTK